jgi:CheY-like chemotaxis protein
VATVVVVDDSADNRRLMEMLLGSRGHRVLSAADAPEGIELIRRERPDLLVCDIVLPTMDGYALVRELRSRPGVESTRVVFNTAHYLDQEMRQLGLACGVEDWIAKPYEPEAMLVAIEQILSRPSHTTIERPPRGP